MARARHWLQKRRPLLLVAVLGLMSVFVALRFRISTSMAELLPTSSDQRSLLATSQFVDSTLTRVMIVTIAHSGGDRAQARSALLALAEKLEAQPGVRRVRTGPPEGLSEAYYRVFFKRRFHFLSDGDEGALQAALSDEGLDAAATRLKKELAGPRGPMVKRVAAKDPWLSFLAHADRGAQAAGDQLTIEEGVFAAKDGSAVGFVELSGSAFDAPRQRVLVTALEREFEALARDGDAGTLRLEYTGANRFAVGIERRMRADATRVSVATVLLVLLLLGSLFRSLRLVALAFVPLVAGLLAGSFFSLLFFGRLHSFTLAFGATLVGVCIDYPAHLYAHHVLGDRGGKESSASGIGHGLWLAALTTVVGLSTLGLTGFPGIREVAVFSGAGVLMAMLTTRYLLPGLLPVAAPTSALRWLRNKATRLLKGLARLPAPVVLAPGVLVLASVFIALPAVQWQDSLRALTLRDDALVAEDARVRARVGAAEMGRFVVVRQPTVEAALVANDETSRALEDAVAAGELEGYSSLHGLLWSASLQERNAAQIRASPKLAARLGSALEGRGFALSGFELEQGLKDAEGAPLTLSELLDSELEPLVSPFIGELSDGTFLVISLLRGLSKPDAVAARIAQIDGGMLADQSGTLDALYASFRQEVVRAGVIGLLLVFLVLVLRYRNIYRALAAFLPSLLAGLATLSILIALGQPLHLLHILSLLLVASMGVDYGVFLAEADRDRPEVVAITLTSLGVACASTMCSFGLLALSDVPALRAIGQTTAIGVATSLLFAPLAAVLSRRMSGGGTRATAAPEEELV